MGSLALQWRVVVHIAFWAQLGVLTRIYVDVLFINGCDGGWGLCLISTGADFNSFGAYFPDIFANMLGSFLMGLLTASSTLSLTHPKAVAVLPSGHPWQEAMALQVGLRTGYCGSLTTFSSWMLQAVQLFVGGTGRQGGQWAQALWALLLGLQVALGSLALGHASAHLIHRWLLRDSRCSPHGAAPHGAAPHDLSSVADATARSSDALRGVQPDAVPLTVPPESSTARSLSGEVKLSGRVSAGPGIERKPPQLGPLTLEAAEEQVVGAGEMGAETREDLAAGRTSKWQFPPISKTDVAALAGLLLLTALWTVLAIVDNKPARSTERGYWLAVLLGQLGALGRWQLARFNGWLSGRLHWFPAGTFAANMLSCALIFACQAVLNTKTAYWWLVVGVAVEKGVCGGLSTVSTLVNEISGMLVRWPECLHAAVYPAVTIVSAVALGLGVYGIPTWIHMS